jgi:hypothetical protein
MYDAEHSNERATLQRAPLAVPDPNVPNGIVSTVAPPNTREAVQDRDMASYLNGQVDSHGVAGVGGPGAVDANLDDFEARLRGSIANAGPAGVGIGGSAHGELSPQEIDAYNRLAQRVNANEPNVPLQVPTLNRLRQMNQAHLGGTGTGPNDKLQYIVRPPVNGEPDPRAVGTVAQLAMPANPNVAAAHVFVAHPPFPAAGVPPPPNSIASDTLLPPDNAGGAHAPLAPGAAVPPLVH